MVRHGKRYKLPLFDIAQGKLIVMNVVGLDIERETIDNDAYRRVLSTTPQMQLVLMSLALGEDIPSEVHRDATQFIRVEQGRGLVQLDLPEGRTALSVEDGSAVLIPAGTRHYVAQRGPEALKLYVLYAPPEHARDTFQPRQHSF